MSDSILQAASLCTDAGDQERQIGRNGTQVSQLVGIGCAHYQPAASRVCAIPLSGQPGDTLIERAALGHQVLNLGG